MPHEIVVDKTDLLDALRKNRETHRNQFLKAQEGYRKRVIQQLDEALAAARNHQSDVQSLVLEIFHLPVPQDHTRDYDREIGMLEMALDTKVEITSKEYEQFVQDHWTWTEEFRSTNAGYTVH